MDATTEQIFLKFDTEGIHAKSYPTSCSCAMYNLVYYSKTTFFRKVACLFRMIFTVNIDYIPK